jgi:putative peptidoglycan lipid II flippase
MNYPKYPRIRQLFTVTESSSVTRRILAAALGVGFASAVVKFISFFKEMVVAFYFGTDRALDVFLIALALPTFAVNVLGGAMQSAFTPVYLEVLHKQGRSAARQLLGSISFFYIAALGLVTLLTIVTIHWVLLVIAHGFSGAELQQAKHLFYVVAAILILTGGAKLFSALLAAEQNFTLPAMASAATPVCTMTLLVLGYRSLGIYALAIAATMGAAVEAGILAWLMRRIRVMPVFAWQGLTPDVKRILDQFLPLVAGAVLMTGTTITDQAMAAMLPSGAVAALNYGNKLPAVIVLLISGALGTAVLPYFSRLIAASDWRSVHDTYRTFVRLVFYSTLPFAAVLVLLSHLIVRLVFQHGAFTAAAGQTVTSVQMCLLMEIPFYTVSILAVRMISALRKTHVLVWGAGISLVVNVSLNYILMKFIGVAGIALSTAFVYLVSMTYLLFLSKHYINNELNGLAT